MDRSWEYINRSQTHECGNWAEAAQLPEKEYINVISVAVRRGPFACGRGGGKVPIPTRGQTLWYSNSTECLAIT